MMTTIFKHVLHIIKYVSCNIIFLIIEIFSQLSWKNWEKNLAEINSALLTPEKKLHIISQIHFQNNGPGSKLYVEELGTYMSRTRGAGVWTFFSWKLFWRRSHLKIFCEKLKIPSQLYPTPANSKNIQSWWLGVKGSSLPKNIKVIAYGWPL